MADKFPKPYVNDVKIDTNTMKYVNDGDFAKMGIGARSSGLPKNGAAPGKGGMSIDHVGGTAGSK